MKTEAQLNDLPRSYRSYKVKRCLKTNTFSQYIMVTLVQEFKGSTKEKVKKHCLLSTSLSCA